MRNPGLAAWALYDWANSAFPTTILTFVFASYFTRQVAPNETLGTILWGTTVAIAEVSVALAGPVFGAIADQMGKHKRWLAAFTLLCVTSTALLWFIGPSSRSLWLALALVGFGIFAADCDQIFYNALLPRLAAPDEVGRWSGWIWAMGYAGGLLCLTISLFAFVEPAHSLLDFDRPSAEHLRATFLFAAAWYAFFSRPLFILTPDTQQREKPLLQAARAGLAQLRDTFSLFWVFALLLGVFVGPVQAASRSYLARIAPAELRNELFGFYALSGKAAAFAGPLLVGWVTYASASQRIGMSVIIMLLLTGFILMLRVKDSDAAQAAASWIGVRRESDGSMRRA